MTNHKKKVQQTKLHLNAGMSKRVVDFVEQNYPKTVVYWESLGDYGAFVIDGLSDVEIRKLKEQILQIYPIEQEDTITTI